MDELSRRQLDALTEAVTTILHILSNNSAISRTDHHTIDHVYTELEALRRERRLVEVGEPASS